MGKLRECVPTNVMEPALAIAKGSLKAAATPYGIARNTLIHRANTKTHKTNIDHPHLLSPEPESELCHRIFQLAEIVSWLLVSF